MSKNRKRPRTAADEPTASTSTAVLDSPEDAPEVNFEEGEPRPAQPWEAWAASDRVGFFDLMSMIPAEAWEDQLLIYLYRLSPAVANKEGDKKYICRYSHAIDEETIKAQHGGGKYHAILKRGTDTVKNAKFSIEGEPILLEGQILRGGSGQVLPPGASASSGPPSDLASVVRQVIEATKGDQTAANAGIEVLKSAMKDGLALNKTILESQLGSTTGSKMGDKVLDMLLPKLLEQKQPDLPPIVNEFLKAAIGLVKNPRETPAPAAASDPLKQLDFVKDLLGVDSIKDLFDQGRRITEQPFWVPLLENAIGKLPVVLHEYAEMQERAFQRALIAHQVRAGAPALGTPGTTPTPAPMAVTERVTLTPEQQAQQMVNTVVEAICRAWDEGYPGDVAGAHLKIGYPQLVEQLKPLLADPVQLSAFIASIPALAERATDAEWSEFQADLIEELNQVAMPPADVPPSVATAEQTAGAPGAEAPAGPPPVRKKKANGHAG